MFKATRTRNDARISAEGHDKRGRVAYDAKSAEQAFSYARYDLGLHTCVSHIVLQDKQ